MRSTATSLQLAIVLALASFAPAAAHAAADDVSDLKAQIKQLDARYQHAQQELEQVQAQLKDFQRQLLDLRGKGEPAPANPYSQAIEQEQGGVTRQPSPQASETQAASSAASPDAGSAVQKEPARSRSAEAVIEQAQGTLFARRFTFEPSLTYSRFDQRQLTLNGFLALDAIFLGNIAVQEVKANIWQLDLTGRYGLTPRLQAYVDAPFLDRSTDYLSGGAGGSAPALSEATVNRSPDIGDVSAGIYYQLLSETPSHPDLVANVALKFPTGSDPYGIKLVQPDPTNNNLTVPQSLPNGNGVYTLFGGLSVLKTIDPVILFANAGMYHNFVRSFDDISTQEGSVTPGKIDLRNSFQWGAGAALALNDRMALTFSYSQLVSQAARKRPAGQDWQTITGSDADAAVFNAGLTYALSDHETMIANLGVGLTPDAPNFQLMFKFPYTF